MQRNLDGIGGGHDAAAGAKITKDKLDEFLDYLEVNVVNVSSSIILNNISKEKGKYSTKSIRAR